MTKPYATCAALIDHNVCCEKTKQCMRAVNWPDDPHAPFNLCLLVGSGTFKQFAASLPQLIPVAIQQPQLDLLT